MPLCHFVQLRMAVRVYLGDLSFVCVRTCVRRASVCWVRMLPSILVYHIWKSSEKPSSQCRWTNYMSQSHTEREREKNWEVKREGKKERWKWSNEVDENKINTLCEVVFIVVSQLVTASTWVAWHRSALWVRNFITISFSHPHTYSLGNTRT